MVMAEIDQFLVQLSRRLDNPNETRQRAWLEIKAKEQNQDLQCPNCDAFVPMRLDTFDDEGWRICLICKIRFTAEEY